MQPTKFIIDAALAQAIAEYLARRPFIEVEQLVNGLRQLQPLPAPKIEKTEEAKAA
jgi:hypothetical protein